MEQMPSPARAERNQRRKLAFVPMWPVVAGLAVVVALVLLVR
jgi:type VI protein secretion system component VasF